MIDYNVKERFYNSFKIIRKEEITDDIALKLMTALCWHYSCTGNDFIPYEVTHKDDLIDAILENAADLKEVEYIRTKVQEIFGYEEDEDE